MKAQEDYVHVFVHLKLSAPFTVKVVCFHDEPKDWDKNHPNKEPAPPGSDSTFISLHLKFTNHKFQRIIHIMDRLAQHLLNRASKDDDHYSRSSSHAAIPLVAALGKTFVKQAVRRGEERRGRPRFQRSERVNLQRLGEYMVDMMEKAEEKVVEEVREASERRRRRHRPGHGHGYRREDGDGNKEGKRRRRRRRHSHEEDVCEKPREQDQHQDQDRSLEQEQEFEQEPEPEQTPRDLQNSTNPNYPYISIPSDPPPQPQQTSHRHSRKTDLRTLKTELEAMSDTLTNLNSRSASHSDCEFYDKFVEGGGRLQEAIGEALGQIRDVEERSSRRRRRRRS